MDMIETRNDMLALLPKGMVIAELGVFTGQFSEIILSVCNPNELHLIDIWNRSVRSGDKDGKNMRRQNLPIVYQQLLKKYADSSIVKLHRMDTQKALMPFKDRYFDFIYIDANHGYDSVYADLNLSLLKSKRYIAGHDYNPRSGVKKAVDHFCNENGLEISCLTKDGCPSFLIDLIEKNNATNDIS